MYATIIYEADSEEQLFIKKSNIPCKKESIGTSNSTINENGPMITYNHTTIKQVANIQFFRSQS